MAKEFTYKGGHPLVKLLLKKTNKVLLNQYYFHVYLIRNGAGNQHLLPIIMATFFIPAQVGIEYMRNKGFK